MYVHKYDVLWAFKLDKGKNHQLLASAERPNIGQTNKSLGWQIHGVRKRVDVPCVNVAVTMIGKESTMETCENYRGGFELILQIEIVSLFDAINGRLNSCNCAKKFNIMTTPLELNIKKNPCRFNTPKYKRNPSMPIMWSVRRRTMRIWTWYLQTRYRILQLMETRWKRDDNANTKTSNRYCGRVVWFKT